LDKKGKGMKIPRLNPGDAVMISWIDACTHENGSWMNEDEYTGREAGVPITSIGIYVKRGKDCIMITGDRHEREGFTTRVARCFDIPLGCIKSIRRLK
jgi:hypothetical protein